MRIQDLPPFSPPYALSGSGFVLVGLLRSLRAQRPPMGGLGVCIVSDYDAPPAEMPICYREVIVSRLAMRGLWPYVEALDLVLDAPIPVELGQRYYQLPKRLDETLTLSADAETHHCRARDLSVSWRCCRPWAQWLSLPLRVAVALGVWVVTSLLRVAGRGGSVRARIQLKPGGPPRVSCRASARVGDLVLTPLFSVYFQRLEVELGAPEKSWSPP